MKEYTSCFLGIPLPIEYQNEFKELLSDIKTLDPNLEIVYAETPHITIYYFDKQPKGKLPELIRRTSCYASVPKGANLKVGGLGFFSIGNPKVLFLDIGYPHVLADFNKVISKEFSDLFAEEDNLEFRPHMTVARMRNEAAQASFVSNKIKLEERLSQASWDFPVTELVIYGVDSTKRPEYQEKIVTIPVK